MVAQEGDAACAALQEVGDLGEQGLAVYSVGAVEPEVVQEHGYERDDEEGGVDVGDKVGFRVRVVCEDGLS